MVLSVGGSLCLLNASRGGSRRGAIVLQVLSGLLIAAVYLTYAYATWVADRIGCLGSCG
jgi:hypothetical protein